MAMFDIAIIGSGPAGISAAINAKIRYKNFVLFGKETGSAKVIKSEKISNYPGLPDIEGPKLAEKFTAHAKSLGIEFKDEQVSAIYKNKDSFMLSAGTEIYEAKTVIIACGTESTKSLPGEREFVGRGVSYCATCDGNLYKGKNIAVICEGKEHEDEVEYLKDLAETVHYFPLFKSEPAGENIKTYDVRPAAVKGEMKVSALELKGGSEISVDGIFILKNVAADVLLGGLEMDEGKIVVGHDMSTNIEGCFACGDCTGYPYQIAKAVGEGNTAAHSAIRYLSAMSR